MIYQCFFLTHKGIFAAIHTLKRILLLCHKVKIQKQSDDSLYVRKKTVRESLKEIENAVKKFGTDEDSVFITILPYENINYGGYSEISLPVRKTLISSYSNGKLNHDIIVSNPDDNDCGISEISEIKKGVLQYLKNLTKNTKV